MTPRSLYVIGGAGVGKSTFTGQLLHDYTFGPLLDLHARHNGKSLVTLRGHNITNGTHSAQYLGVMRDYHPGTDGLNRANTPVVEEWLQQGQLPPAIVAEGATLAMRRVLQALHAHTKLRVLALHCDPMVTDLRLLRRGTVQVDSFVRSTVTKTENLAKDLDSWGVPVHWIDTADMAQLDLGRDLGRRHLHGELS